MQSSNAWPRATRVGSDTTLAQMGRLVADAQTGKARVARLADRISAVFVPIVLVIAVLTFAGWLLATGSLGVVAGALGLLTVGDGFIYLALLDHGA